MISFDLRCSNAHVFEAWFRSSADYADQKARGLVACPFCEDRAVEKAVMAPAVAAKGNRREEKRPVASGAPAEIKAVLEKLAEMQAQIEASSEYVGERFADEARAIHHGEAEARGIYGEASLEEARALAEEGVPVAPLPFRTRRSSDA